MSEPCLQRWIEDLNPHSKNYAYYFLKYYDWFRGKRYWDSAERMLNDFKALKDEERFAHVDRLKEYIKSKPTGTSDKRNTWHAVSSLYAFHRLTLPKLGRNEAQKLFNPNELDTKRALELSPLQLDEVRQLILNAPMPYKAVFAVLFQGAMGLAEFDQFNRTGWKKIISELDKPGPAQVILYRSKTSRGKVSKYYTFLGEDAKTLTKQWLKMRPTSDQDALFLTYRKNDHRWVPVTSAQIGSTVTATARKAKLIEENDSSSPANRYHIHAHEFRDLFKSLCQLKGVKNVASELFLGHITDKSGYDKSPEYDVEFFRNEYRKVEPYLNVLSNPKAMKGEEDISIAIKKQLLLASRYTEEEIEKLNVGDLTDEELSKKIRERLLGVSNGNPKQKVVPSSEVEKYLKNGYEFVDRLSEDKAIVQVPQ